MLKRNSIIDGGFRVGGATRAAMPSNDEFFLQNFSHDAPKE